MRKYLLFTIFASLLFSFPINAQLVQEGTLEKSKFRSQFLKNRTKYQNKSTACAADTIYYGRFNASSHGYVQIQPGNGQTGVGQFFAVDDSLKLYGMNFYAYSSTQTQTVTCKVFYANASKRPAGTALATKTYSLSTGFNNIAFMRRTVLFDNPVDIAANFVITIEVSSNGSNIVFGSNSWADSNGLGNNYANLKFSTGWTNSLNIGTPPVPFDADFYFEPIVKYDMTAQFEHGPTSCMGNGLPFEYINTSTFATNPQFSFRSFR